MQITELERFREVVARVFVDRRVIGYASAWPTRRATRTSTGSPTSRR